MFAGDKLGNLGIFDASQNTETQQNGHSVGKEQADDEGDDNENVVGPAITSIHLHTRTISSFQFSPNNPSHLLTCSYDSSIRLLDLATSVSKELYGPEDRQLDEPLSGLEVDPLSPNVLYFSRLDGHVGRHDTRAPQTATTIWQMSEKKIGGFSIHQQYPHFIATASLDRTMRLWDLRKITRSEFGSGRQPAQLGERTSRLSVSHAAFNSVGQVATSSYDDTIKVHSFEGMGNWSPGETLPDQAMEPNHVVKHNNQTGRWVTMYRILLLRPITMVINLSQLAPPMADESLR